MAEIHLQRIGRLAVAALVENGRVEDLAIDRASADGEAASPLYGTIYRATCETLRKGLGAFLRLAPGESGFLQAGARGAPADAGEVLIVQVKNEGERAPGDESGKAAVVSREIALAGRFLVHLPFARGVKQSKRLEDERLKDRLGEPLGHLPGGFVLRQSAARAGESEIVAEARRLADEAVALNARKAGRLLPAPCALRRLLSDHGAAPVRRIAADEAGAPAAAATLAAFAPDLAPLLERDESLDLAPVVQSLHDRRVDLSGGASLVIEPTAALLAIDVNAGPRSDTARVNREAAAEIARQLRLRALGGQIVIDFLGTEKRAFREDLLPLLNQLAAADTAGWQLFGFSHLGLCESTRTRRTRPHGVLTAMEAALRR